jgi:hypothetical protein
MTLRLGVAMLLLACSFVSQARADKVTFPTIDELFDAQEALKQGNSAPLKRYYEHKLAWYEDVLKGVLDTHENAMNRTLHFLTSATETATLLGDLNFKEHKLEQSKAYYKKAQEFLSQNAEYLASLEKGRSPLVSLK